MSPAAPNTTPRAELRPKCVDEVSQYHAPVDARQTTKSSTPSPSMSASSGTSPRLVSPHCTDAAPVYHVPVDGRHTVGRSPAAATEAATHNTSDEMSGVFSLCMGSRAARRQGRGHDRKRSDCERNGCASRSLTQPRTRGQLSCLYFLHERAGFTR